MKLSFLGAAHEVTGSCHFIEACGKKILVDCGMQQGQDDDTQELPVVPADIDYLFLTHAHIDHSGKLPLLSKMGFNGKIFTTVNYVLLCYRTAHIFRNLKRNGKIGNGSVPARIFMNRFIR